MWWPVLISGMLHLVVVTEVETATPPSASACAFTTSQTYLVWLFALFSARLSFNFLSYFWRPAVLMDLIYSQVN